ncbi:hypothetical protein EST38_g2230 [Candolleomyces aberdarensis]|uniref:Uncharacterized protein n=1 Tax=Candolleomyces aberdarensis TaxID=2316362 RepID=A0A4Q2DWJ9_9AGAR|nr:hypothetical protein EST38_g2230 [Candolleomyces aberdarensis]
MSIATDIYFITNVQFSKALTLEDANKIRTGVVSSADEASSKVELSSGPESRSNHLRIHRAPLIAETIVQSTKIEFEWMDTTNDPFDALLSGTLENDSLPEDSFISFPKPLEVIWNGTLVGEARISGEFRPVGYHQLNRQESNAQLVLGATESISRFIQSIIRERSINVDIVTDEVNVYASGQEYKNVRVVFRKTLSMEGFNCFKDNVISHSIRVVGSDPGGGGITAVSKIEIRNPTNITVRLDDIPVEVYYKTEKIGNLNLPSFKLHQKRTGTADALQELHTQFRPEQPRNSECQDFVKDYITTDHSLTVIYNLTGTVIKLGATQTVSIPPFRVESSFKGINKQFFKGISAYISIARTLISKRISFDFDFENPMHTDLKILAFEGEVKRKNKLFCVARANNVNDMIVEADRTSLSPLFKGGSIEIRRHEMLKMVGRGSLKVTVKVIKATVHIGEFELPDLQFELQDPVRAK